MNKVLITGGAGFIGLHLARELHKNGYAVDLVDNFSRGVEDDELRSFSRLPGVRLINLDLLKPQSWDKLDREYIKIFHLAAIIGVRNVLQRPYDVLVQNVRLLELAISFAHKCSMLDRFVFASTSEVYAGTLKYFELPIPTSEDAPIALTPLNHPRTSYMLSKIYGEAMCHLSGLPWLIIRPHNFYGPRMGMAHVIPEQLQKMYFAPRGGKIVVLSPDHKRTFCFIDDAVKIISRAAASDQCIGEVLNIGSQEGELTIMELCTLLLEITGRKDLTLVPGETTPGSPARRCPDMSKAVALLGELPSTSLSGGVEATFAWYKKNVFDADGVCAS